MGFFGMNVSKLQNHAYGGKAGACTITVIPSSGADSSTSSEDASSSGGNNSGNGNDGNNENSGTGGSDDTSGQPGDGSQSGTASLKGTEAIIPIGSRTSLAALMEHYGDMASPIPGTLTWESLDENVAVITGGDKVTGTREGSTELIAYHDNVTAGSIKVKSISGFIPVSDIVIDVRSIGMVPGQGYSLSAVAHPDTATVRDIFWSSTAPDVVSVDDKGNVKALRAGEAHVTASSHDGKCADHCFIKVYGVDSTDGTDGADTGDDHGTDGDDTGDYAGDDGQADIDGRFLIWDEFPATLDIMQENGEDGTMEVTGQLGYPISILEGEATTTIERAMIVGQSVSFPYMIVNKESGTFYQDKMVCSSDDPSVVTIVNGSILYAASPGKTVCRFYSNGELIASVPITVCDEGQAIVIAADGGGTVELVSYSAIGVNGKLALVPTRPEDHQADDDGGSVGPDTQDESKGADGTGGTDHDGQGDSKEGTASGSSIGVATSGSVTDTGTDTGTNAGTGAAVASIQFDSVIYDLSVKGFGKMAATSNAGDLPSEGLRWESSDPDTVAVDQNGRIVGISEGRATITGYYKKDIDIKASAVVNVYSAGSPLPVSGTQDVYTAMMDTDGSLAASYQRCGEPDPIEAVIPASITLNGHEVNVISIATNAFADTKTLRRATIGKNVRQIGPAAFKGCRNLKTVVLETRSLSRSSVGNRAFKGIKKKCKVYVPSDRLKEYKRWIRKKMPKKVKVYPS